MAFSSTTPGRNDPCHCGSGRKFKHCCLGAQSAEDSARLKIRRVEGHIVDILMAYAMESWGAPFLATAWHEFFLWEAVPEEMIETPEFSAMFIPWVTTLYVPDPEDENTDDEWPVEPVALHWLANERPLLDAYDRHWITAACRSPLSAFVVEAVAPGRSIDLRDILTGRRFHVLEQGASRTLKRHHVTFSRVVTVANVSVMFGATPFVIAAPWHTRIIDWRESTRAGGLMTREDLEDFEIEIRGLYLDIADEVLNPTLPQLTNTDGDPIALTTLTFSVEGTVEEVATQLAPLARLPGDGLDADALGALDDHERNDAGVLTGATLSWKKVGNKKQKSWTNTVLGTLRLTDARIVVEVNSEKRAAKCIREMTKLLGTRLTLLSTDVIDPLELLAAPPEPGQRPERPPEAQAPELIAMEEELFKQHLEEWIDQKVPALGNRTPRVVARTALGRERLSALISSFESGQVDRLPNGRALLNGLRARLGLPE